MFCVFLFNRFLKPDSVCDLLFSFLLGLLFLCPLGKKIGVLHVFFAFCNCNYVPECSVFGHFFGCFISHIYKRVLLVIL